MNSCTVSANAIIPFDYQASLKVDTDPAAADTPIPGSAPDAGLLKDNSTRFASALAHEIRNPLTNINLSTELLTAGLQDNELKMYVDIITRSSVRINSLVTELLKFQATEDSTVHQYSLHRLIDEVLVIVADRIALKKIKIRKDYTLLDCKIWGDMQKLKIAFTNIIINAIDAMPAKKGELTLVIQSMADKYVLVIADNGTGISNENLQNIFKPYFTSKPGGMGLGLSTTLAILQSNHIGVDVRSEEGKGTRFILFVNKIV